MAATEASMEPEALTELMDATWHYIKENMTHWSQGARKAMNEALSQDFPNARGPQLRFARFMAKGLHDACREIGDACRAQILSREQAEAQLMERFPGFSPETYAQAVSYGMFSR